MDYVKRLKKTNNGPSLTQWLNKQQAENEGLPCELLEIRSLKDDLEKCVAYRNKCEFTIGKYRTLKISSLLNDLKLKT